MTPTEEIKELDQMVNDREALIYVLVTNQELTDEQQKTLENIKESYTPFSCIPE